MANATFSSLFCVFNNPEHNYTYKHNDDGSLYFDDNGNKVILSDEPTAFTGMTASAMCEYIVKNFVNGDARRSCWAAYCISADGLRHIHAVFEATNGLKFRDSSIRNVVGKAIHMEPTKGTKKEVEDYINKQGKFEEKGEVIVSQYKSGEIKGSQGQRKDLDELYNMIKSGKTPEAIFRENISARKYEKLIRDAFFDFREQHTGYIRNVDVIWHVGATGTGKSYELNKYAYEHPGSLYRVTDYLNGGFDKYCGEPVLALEEFRGQLPYATLLNVLDCYKSQIHARYTNALGLWTTVHITSPLGPDQVYKKMVDACDDNIDLIGQLYRRINCVKYHFIKDGHRYSYTMNDVTNNYSSYDLLVMSAEEDYRRDRVNIKCEDDEDYEKLYIAPADNLKGGDC